MKNENIPDVQNINASKFMASVTLITLSGLEINCIELKINGLSKEICIPCD